MNKNIRKYVITTYVAFWIPVLVAGVILLFSHNPLIGKVAGIPCSWTPNLVLFFMFKRLCPKENRKDFFKGLFAEKVNIRLAAILIVLQGLAFIGSLLCASSKISWSADFSISISAIAFNLVNSILTGATGEEGGWRGYLHPILTHKYGIVKGSVVIGIIWGFWHAPLWFFSNGYIGLDLVKYILFFLIFIIAEAIIIGICYSKNKNILIPVLIHFMTNFTMGFYNKDVLNIIGYFAIFYVLICLGCIIWLRKTAK